MRLPAELRLVVQALVNRQARPLIVGGAVRDHVLGYQPKDFDVEVYGVDIDVVLTALETLGSVQAVGRSFGVFKVNIGDFEVDVSLPRRERQIGAGHRAFEVDPDPFMSPKDAAARRDYTINALAFDPQREELLDFFGGIDDLRQRVLRHTSEAFVEDPLRVLRGLQFAGRFNLKAAPETLELAKSIRSEYTALSLERIWGEWWKWAAKSTHPSAGLRFLAESGWRSLFPELELLQGCPQDPEWHPEGDVWTHTLYVCDAAAEIAERDTLPSDERGVLVLAALCHDLGKPETTMFTEGRIRSRGHDSALSTLERYLGRINTPAGLVRRIVVLCKHHLAHLDFQGSRRHVRRLARALGEAGETIEMLARLVEADGSGRPPLPKGLPTSMKELTEVAVELHTLNSAPSPLLLGRHLIELGMKPGPEMGQLLDAAFEAQLSGVFDSLAGAQRWAMERLRR